MNITLDLPDDAFAKASRFPLAEGRPVTQKAVDRLLLEDGLP